ncbi:MAG TPA: glycosyltransferase family 4 protein [Stellaceae bacterium]|jgi:glycosyltransferase involved in cell wall biosynthesis|nr:glycosyltransferase family 4 protein [Stellaceae bacterium]
MADIVMVDDGIAFDGRTAEDGPLGGAETAFVALAEALAARGHRVEARSRAAASLTHRDVRWAPTAQSVPQRCDLYIANRGALLLGLVPQPKRRALWLHNPARYLAKPRNAWRLAWYRPTLITTGAYHASTIPPHLIDGGHVVIPYGVLDGFRHVMPRDPPPPRAIFTSNPLRGLDWLLDLWVAQIRPAVPEAELHIYAGAAVYGGAITGAGAMEKVLARADALAGDGVFRHAPVGRAALAQMLSQARVMLYRGDPGETFCLALAEAQAVGVPAIVQPLGSVGERVRDRETGRVAATDSDFIAAAVAALRDDTLWTRWHRAALATQRGLGWDEVAERYEALLG